MYICTYAHGSGNTIQLVACMYIAGDDGNCLSSLPVWCQTQLVMCYSICWTSISKIICYHVHDGVCKKGDSLCWYARIIWVDRSYASFKGGDMHGFVDELYHIYLQEHTIGHKEQPQDWSGIDLSDSLHENSTMKGSYKHIPCWLGEDFPYQASRARGLHKLENQYYANHDDCKFL